MIPSDIKITPLSGSGDSSVSMTMGEYTGRVAKPTREVWVYDTDDTASDMIEVDQYPKTEFIGLNDPLIFSVLALGGEIIVTGTSNSSALKPVEFDETLEFELSINGEVQSSWSPDSPIITGDIGADEEYSFSLKVTVPENQSTSQKSWTFQLSNNAQIITATITINQAAGIRTYSEINISEFSYSEAPASGAALSPNLAYSQTWGWNGDILNGGTITSGASVSYKALAGDITEDNLDVSTGVIAVPSSGTRIYNKRDIMLVEVTVSMNGKEATKGYTLMQEKNVPEELIVVADFHASPTSLPASGGIANLAGHGSISIRWSSGEIGPADEGSPLGYSVKRTSNVYTMEAADGFTLSENVITAEGRGTVPGSVRYCGNVTRTFTVTLIITEEYGGGTLQDTDTVTVEHPVSQEANVQTQTGIRIVGDTVGTQGWIPYEYWDNINAAGNASTIPGDDSNTSGWAIRFTGYRQYSYTSGATDEETVTNISHSLGAQKNVDWIGYHTYGYVLNKQGDSNNAYRGTTIGNERTAEVWWEDNGFESNHLSITQAKNVPVSGATTQATFSYPDNVIPPAGGHSYAESNGAFSVTWSSGAVSYPSGTPTGFTYTPVGSYTMVATEGFSILDYNGRITATGMGSILGSRSCGDVTRVLYYTVTVSDTYGGGSFDTTSFTKVLTSPVTQGVNERIYDTPIITLGTPSDIPASGGTVSSAAVLSVVQPFHYTSGTTATDTDPARTNEVWTPVTADSKGTVIVGRTAVGQLEYSCFCHGVQGSAAVEVYQEANEPEEAQFWSLNFESLTQSVPYTGGTHTINPNNQSAGGADISYTSGASGMSDTTIAWSSEVTDGSSWITKLSDYNKFKISKNTDYSPRNGVIEFTAVQTIPGMGFLGSDVQRGITGIRQAAQPMELYFDETSIPTVPEEGGEVFLTIHSNVYWGFFTGGIPAASTGIRAEGSTGSFSPLAESDVSASNAPGDYEIRLYYDSNQSTSEADLFVTAFSLSPERTVQLSGVQEAASSYLEVAPMSLEFGQSGGTLILQISSNTSWTIDGTVNPDLQPKIQIVGTENCIHCGQCDPVNNPNGPVSTCPVGEVLEYSNDLQRFEVINPNPCISCGSCVLALATVCPVYDATGEAGVGIKLGSQN